MPEFLVKQRATNGRLGLLTFEKSGDIEISDIETPFLFPVAAMMTGTTPRGGGLFRYLLRDGEYSLMRRQIPILAQVLHFLNFGVGANGFHRWRQRRIRGYYNSELNLGYAAPIFLDSGGFQLMWRSGLNLDRYGIDLKPENEAQSITDLQLDLGANIIASLDYPLPPQIHPKEAEERTERSRRNAIKTALYLRNRSERPFLFMPVHGTNPDSAKDYVKILFRLIDKHDLQNDPIGLAIGSLVPLRLTNNNLHVIIEISKTITKSIPKRYRERIPVHIFGITGLLVPFLAYSGIDTFDSSTFSRQAASLRYIDPKSRQNIPVLEMMEEDIEKCSCPICQQLDLRRMQTALSTDSKSKPLPDGTYKSSYYAQLALHNLYLDQKIVDATREAIQSDSLDDYVVEVARQFPKMGIALDAIARNDVRLKKKASRSISFVQYPVPTKSHENDHFQSLNHTPHDFNINANGYIPEQRHILLILPCSAEKPYSSSRTHRHITDRLDQEFSQWREYVHQVSLSGLYGPVPEECEKQAPVLEYNFKLQYENVEQTELCIKRLEEYLYKHESRYNYYIAYGTSKAYRRVFEKVAQRFNRLVVLPRDLRSRKLTEFFRASNVDQLINFIREHSSSLGTDYPEVDI